VSPGNAAPASSQTYRRSQSKAIYGQISYDLSVLVSGLKLDLGVRRTRDKVSVCGDSVPGGQPRLNEEDCTRVSLTQRAAFNATTWTGGLDFQVSDDVFLYLATRRGCRAGGINSPVLGTAIASVQTYKPETITDIEIHMNSTGRVANIPYHVAIAGHRGRYKGIQRNYTLPPNFDGDNDVSNDPTAGIVLNSGAAILEGVEFDGSLHPFQDLTLSFSGAYTKAYYTSLTVSPFLQSAGLIPANALQNKLLYVLILTYGAAAEYSPLVGEIGRLLFRVDYYCSDSFYLNERPAADTAIRVKGHDLVNACVGVLDIRRKNVDATFFVNNLSNKAYVAGSRNFAPALSVVSAIYGTPRTFGLELRYHF